MRQWKHLHWCSLDLSAWWAANIHRTCSQCRAVEVVAIDKVMPNTRHRWCKWHGLEKAKESHGSNCTKRSKFRTDFHKIIHHVLTADVFETGWNWLTETHGLQKHPYLTQIYSVQNHISRTQPPPCITCSCCARRNVFRRQNSVEQVER